MTSQDFEQQRLKDIEDNLARERELLKQFEDTLRYENDPRIKARYQQDIERQKQAIAEYQQEYAQLQQQLTNSTSTSEQKIEQDNQAPMTAQQSIQIFLAHASEDKKEVRKLYELLLQRGYHPWLDEKDLMPGQNWRTEIPKAIKNSDFVILCLSNTSVQKQGYLQREFRLALDKYAEKTPGTIFLIPLKFNDCQVPDLQLPDVGVNLRDLQWVNYWESDGLERLLRAIEYQLNV